MKPDAREREDAQAVPEARGRLVGTVAVPGSKSLTCRHYLLAALAAGRSTIRGPLRSDDTDRLLAALETLGASVTDRGDCVGITGGGGRLPGSGRVDLGDGGTPARFMMAIAALANGPVEVDGSPRMRERPVSELAPFLTQLGATVELTAGHLPARITPIGAPPSGDVSFTVGPTASSQFISAVALIAPFTAAAVTMDFDCEPTSRSYIDLTVESLRAWGATVEWDGARLAIRPAVLPARELAVEPDASSAVYWWTAAAIVPGSSLATPAISRSQPDARHLDTLAAMGAVVTTTGDSTTVAAPRQPLTAPADPVDLRLAPDSALAAAVAAACCAGTTTLTGLATLRVKETDRIAALATELERIGCRCQQTEDSLTIDPEGRHQRAATIATYGDHRMAMAFAILGLDHGHLTIADPMCVNKSYPAFWETLGRLTDTV